MGMPKALVRDAGGRPWVTTAVDTLLAGGCDAVVVVLGASAWEARPLIPDRPAVRTVVASTWAEGMAASLAAGLAGAREDDETAAVLVSLVDLPDLPVAAVRRVLDVPGDRRGALRRAVHGGRPGHPVLVGQAHWAPLAAVLHGDLGAGPYLRSAGAERVECGDLWDGHDHDRPGPGRR
ncbi:nucleotidyltransferase family protein [Curtobacterium sp. MCBD17_008]|nr:nucleotidyltransferase family protein [Curtobacterium sp. MCBD17_008]